MKLSQNNTFKILINLDQIRNCGELKYEYILIAIFIRVIDTKSYSRSSR